MKKAVPYRPRRSVLYVPATNGQALKKAQNLACDALIIDLEDSVAPEMKNQAREQAIDALQRYGYGAREIVVRVNGLDTPWGEDDLNALAKQALDAVLLPKINSSQDISDAADRLGRQGAPMDLPLWIMAETPRGILDMDAIAAHPRLHCIVMGTSDLTRDLRARHTAERIGLLAPLSFCILAARAHGRDILDGVYLQLDDPDGFRAACEQGRDMGFDGKTVIHPEQLEAANRLFAPSASELAHAEAILAAWRQAETELRAVAVVDGQLIEHLHVREAQRQLALAAAIEEHS